jgi:hypothetical protein
MRMQ